MIFKVPANPNHSMITGVNSPKGNVWLSQAKEGEALWSSGCGDGLLGGAVWEVQGCA